MKCIFLLFLLWGCQDFNSNSSDRTKHGPIVLEDDGGSGGSDGGGGGSGYSYAYIYNIIQKRCVDCHSGYHDLWSSYTSTNAWIEHEYTVIPGEPDNSLFIQKIINSGKAGSNMPQGGSALPDAEYQALKTWIKDMQ